MPLPISKLWGKRAEFYLADGSTERGEWMDKDKSSLNTKENRHGSPRPPNYVI